MRELKFFGPFGNLGYGGFSDEVWEGLPNTRKVVLWNGFRKLLWS